MPSLKLHKYHVGAVHCTVLFLHALCSIVVSILCLWFVDNLFSCVDNIFILSSFQIFLEVLVQCWSEGGYPLHSAWLWWHIDCSRMDAVSRLASGNVVVELRARWCAAVLLPVWSWHGDDLWPGSDCCNGGAGDYSPVSNCDFDIHNIWRSFLSLVLLKLKAPK